MMNFFELLISSALCIAMQSAALPLQKDTTSNERKSLNLDERSKRTAAQGIFNKYAALVLTQGLYHSHQQTANKKKETEPVERSARNFPLDPEGNQKLVNFYAPTIKVTVQDGAKTENISVAMEPDMSTYDTILAAETLYRYRHGRQRVNPFGPSLMIYDNGSKACAILEDIGGQAGRWTILVRDANQQIIHEDICIPSRRMIVMRPGYTLLIQPFQLDN
ncbi:uncharacterized protein [Watersipora subatra]|uniref:uncharacterized protein n=1 Tax=Watersipora subatra TaxID=2589382 RepID=UPI00355C3BAD